MFNAYTKGLMKQNKQQTTNVISQKNNSVGKNKEAYSD